MNSSTRLTSFIIRMAFFFVVGVLTEARAEDCNNNGIPDDQDIANCSGLEWCRDCNQNGLPDACDVFLAWASVGDAGNSNDSSNGAGGVAYEYLIGKFEVTNGQYRAFLNAVAAVDTYNLYSTQMAGTYGGIVQTGSSGSLTYLEKAPGWDARPVNFVGWYDAARFANWLHNGQPRGAQNASTTEDGAYTFPGVTTVGSRNAEWRVALPDQMEWYKAAYYKGGGLNTGYWTYATQSDTAPLSEAPPGHSEPPGSANYNNAAYAVGPPDYLSGVGAYTYSPGPYGTFDQNGNLQEMNESECSLPNGPGHMVRGGSWGVGVQWLAKSSWACVQGQRA